MTAFGDQTAALQVSVANENQEIVKQYDAIITLTDVSDREHWFDAPILPGSKDDLDAAALLHKNYAPKTWRDERANVLTITATVEELMIHLTAYSSSLGSLAAKGETGRDSVDKAMGSLKSIADIAGVSTAGMSTAAATVVIKVAGEIADLVTRAQAQASLNAAMNVITDGGGAQKVARILREYSAAEASLVDSLGRDRIMLERYRTGTNLVAFYNLESSWRARERAFALLNLDDAARNEALRSRSEAQLYADLLKCYSPTGRGCPRASAVSDLASAQLLLRTVSQDARGYFDTRDQIQAWEKQQKDRLSAIADAADVWAQEHDRLAAYFHECAGIRAVYASCGTYSATNLKAAGERIQGIFSSLKTAPSDDSAAVPGH